MSDPRALRAKAEWKKTMLETFNLQKGQNTLFLATYSDLKEAIYSVLKEIENEKQAKEEKLYSPTEFAQRHGISKPTIHRWVKAGILKQTKIGGKVYYKDSDLKEG